LSDPLRARQPKVHTPATAECTPFAEKLLKIAPPARSKRMDF